MRCPVSYALPALHCTTCWKSARYSQRHAVRSDKMSKFFSQGRRLMLHLLVAAAATAPGDPAPSHPHDLGVGEIFRYRALQRRRRLSRAASPFPPSGYEAEKTFSQVIAMDRGCAMAYWGIAMSLYHPLWSPPMMADLRKGIAAIEKANSIGSENTA